jgi:predicted methyltransferase MtxX (methanogen marker protein 4)
MLTDSSSPQEDYNSLLAWLKLSQTQEVLNLLRAEAEDLRQAVIHLVPSRDLGRLLSEYLHREQVVGEVRGLLRLDELIAARRHDLEATLKLIDEPQPIEDDGQ